MFDEIEIRPGLFYLELAGQIIGRQKGPILEKAVSNHRANCASGKQHDRSGKVDGGGGSKKKMNGDGFSLPGCDCVFLRSHDGVSLSSQMGVKICPIPIPILENKNEDRKKKSQIRFTHYKPGLFCVPIFFSLSATRDIVIGIIVVWLLLLLFKGFCCAH